MPVVVVVLRSGWMGEGIGRVDVSLPHSELLRCTIQLLQNAHVVTRTLTMCTSDGAQVTFNKLGCASCESEVVAAIQHIVCLSLTFRSDDRSSCTFKNGFAQGARVECSSAFHALYLACLRPGIGLLHCCFTAC